MLAVALVLILPLLWTAITRPTFARLAWRNVARRKGEAALVVVGALLGTAIITAAFVVGDTIEAAGRDAVRTNLGPVDEVVRVADADDFPAVVEALTEPPLSGVEVLPARSVGGVLATDQDAGERRAEPATGLLELDIEAARSFGDDTASTGLADVQGALGAGEAILGEPLADTLGVAPGDTVVFNALGAEVALEVRQVLPQVGLVGYLPAPPNFGEQQPPVPAIVAPGTIDVLVEGATRPGQPPTPEVLVANGGGLFESAEATSSVTAELEERLVGLPGVEVVEIKQQLLDDAARFGANISELYQGIGGFSVIAGILLLVNLFVMLAEERKSELGMLRALGFRRNHLVRTFAIEGSLYSIVAAVLGAILGIGVGAVITSVASGIFDPDGQSSYAVVVRPDSLITGGSIGLVISMFTVWGTSLRISRLNIIRAIRDLPETGVQRRRRWTVAASALGIALGVLLLVTGLDSGNGVAVLAGPAIALFCAIPPLRLVLPDRVAAAVPALLALLWGLTVFTVAGEAMGGAEISVFVVQGVVLVAAAVTLSAAAEPLWQLLVRRVSASGGGLSARLGLAYPLSRRFRTGMLLGMYAIVVFTMTFMSVLSGIFMSQVPTAAAEMSAGYDLYLDTNPANPVPAEELLADERIEEVATLDAGFATFDTPSREDGQPWPITGIDEAFLSRGVPALESRLEAFADDRAAFEAVLADPGLAIVSGFFLQTGGGPPEQIIKPGSVTTARDPVSGVSRELTIAGVVNWDMVFNGALASSTVVDELSGGRAAPSRTYIAVVPGVDAEEFAAELQGTFLANGARARTFTDRAESAFSQQNSFFVLLQGYLGLGLLIGIAGLGVVMVRAVRERRRQIGMLRAMGVSARTVRRSFVLEAAFVAAQGIVLGMVLGSVTSYQLLVSSSAFGDQQLDFALPWAALAVIFVVPLAASLLATAVPSTQAARIAPAAALRIAD